MIVVLSFLLGLIEISVGVGMISLPAGIITSGISLVVLSFVLSRGSGPDKP